jgi:hypothetical protein
LNKHTVGIHSMHRALRIGTQCTHARVLNPLLLHCHSHGLLHLACCTPWHAVWRWELWGRWCSHTVEVCGVVNRASRIVHHLTTVQIQLTQTCTTTSVEHYTLCLMQFRF